MSWHGTVFACSRLFRQVALSRRIPKEELCVGEQPQGSPESLDGTGFPLVKYDAGGLMPTRPCFGPLACHLQPPAGASK